VAVKRTGDRVLWLEGDEAKRTVCIVGKTGESAFSFLVRHLLAEGIIQ
jgi:hypothetical protein